MGCKGSPSKLPFTCSKFDPPKMGTLMNLDLVGMVGDDWQV